MSPNDKGRDALAKRQTRRWREILALRKAIVTGEYDCDCKTYNEDDEPVVSVAANGDVVLEQRSVGPGKANLGGHTNQMQSNHATVFEALQEDFSKEETLAHLGRDWKKVDDMIKQHQEELLRDISVPPEEITSLQDVCPLQVLTDGKPAVQLAAMQRSGKYPDLAGMQFFAGGFHKVKELYVLTGKQHANTVLKALLHAIGRITDGQKKWIMKPGDPNDCARLLRELHYALLLVICDELMAAREAKGVSEEPTPFELEEFMLERASQCPAAYATLLWHRDMELIHWMEDTERDGDPERAFAEYQLLLPMVQRIHVLNNATNYTPMVAREILRWKLESEGFKKFFAHHCYTVWTADGMRQFADRWMECVVRAVRAVLGHVMTRSHDMKIRAVSTSLSEICEARCWDWFRAHGDGDEGVSQCKVRSVKASQQFHDGRKFFRDIGIFKAGNDNITPFEVKAGDCGFRSGRGGKSVPRTALIGLDGKELSLEYLTKVLEVADIRAAKYAEAAVDDNFDYKYDISAVDATAQHAADQYYAIWARSHSVDEDELEKSLSKEKLKLEIMELHHKASGCMQGVMKSTMNKPELVKLLASSRKEFHKACPPPPRPVAKATVDDVDVLPPGHSLPMSHWLMQNLLKRE